MREGTEANEAPASTDTLVTAAGDPLPLAEEGLGSTPAGVRDGSRRAPHRGGQDPSPHDERAPRADDRRGRPGGERKGDRGVARLGGEGDGREGAGVRAAADEAGDAALTAFVREHPALFVLGGAGCSTASGLGDYRDRNGEWKRRQPITGQTFLGDPLARARYWARSAIGWPAFGSARPGAAHHALATLQRAGYVRHLVTQNVDGLHQRAGHEGVVELHGTLATVGCVRCGHTLPRDDFQLELLAANPWLASLDAAYAPDGDADLELASPHEVSVPDCPRCGGLLKPDVVFFGENVPKETVALAMERLRGADALLVAGSSLMVFSGFRFCRDAAARGQPIVIVNDGRTRADELATLKVEGDCGTRLSRLASAVVRG